MQSGESIVTMRPTMPFRRQNHQHIDDLRHGPYIAAYELVAIHYCAFQSPPPSHYGTDAHSRVIVRAAGFAALPS